MIEFLVIEKRDDEDWKGYGTHTFKLAPRQGEYIEFNDAKGIGQIYEVIAVIHPLQPTQTAGDLIIKYVDTNVNFRKSL